jgi:signal transduction histidine kinase
MNTAYFACDMSPNRTPIHRFFLLYFLLPWLLFIAAFSCKNQETKVGMEDVPEIENRFAALCQSNNYGEALIEINRLIAYAERENKDSLSFLFKVNKAELLRKLRDLNAALSLLDSELERAERMQVNSNKAYYYNRKAAILYELNRPEEALVEVQKAQQLDSILGEECWRISSNLTIEGAIYKDLEQYENAQQVLKKAAAFAKSQDNEQEYSQSLYNLITAFYKNEDHDSVLVYAHSLFAIKTGTPIQELTHKTLHTISKSYYALGQNDSAFKFADSAYYVSFNHWLEVVEDRVEMFKASDALIKEQLQNQVLETENKRQALLTYLLVTIAFSLGLILLLIYRQKVRYQRVSDSKERINAQLEDALAFNNKLIGVVAHDIRTPMANISAVIDLYQQGELSKEMMEQLMLQLGDASQKANQLLENLLRWVSAQDSAFSPQFVELDLKKLISDVVDETQTQINNKKVQLEMELESCRLKADPDYLGLIVRNLLTNAVKFSHTGGKITISMTQEENRCCIKIQDRGVGMSAKKIERLLSGRPFSQVGTQSERGTGLGIKLVLELSKAMGGTVSFESEEGKGTTAMVSFPVTK